MQLEKRSIREYLNLPDLQFGRFQKRAGGAENLIFEVCKSMCHRNKKQQWLGRDRELWELAHDKFSGLGDLRQFISSRNFVKFNNASMIFFGRHVVREFMEYSRDSSAGHNTLNQLRKSVYAGLADKDMLAELRARAIMEFAFVRSLETVCLARGGALSEEMQLFWNMTVKKLQDWHATPSLVVSGGDSLWGFLDATKILGSEPRKRRPFDQRLDMYMEEVLKPCDSDDAVLQMISDGCLAGAKKLIEHSKEHLEGGQFFTMDADT